MEPASKPLSSSPVPSTSSKFTEPIPRIMEKPAVFDHTQSMEMKNFSSPPKDEVEDRTTNWKKALLIRDLDLVQASIKIIMAMPSNSKQSSNLGKLICSSLKDVEGVLLHNESPLRRLDLSSPSSRPWNRKGDETLSDAHSPSGPWRKALLARNLDLIYTCVHAILLGLPQKDRRQIVDAAFVALMDLQAVILNETSSSQQITKFVCEINQPDESKSNPPSLKPWNDVTQNQAMGEHHNRRESNSLMEPEKQMESQNHPQNIEDPRIFEEEQFTLRSPKTKSPRNLEGPQHFVDPKLIPGSSNEKESHNFVGPQKLNNIPSLGAPSAFLDYPKNKTPPTDHRASVSQSIVEEKEPSKLLCCLLCNRRLTEGKCVSCKNFVLKMENSMKQNVFYECSHANNSGGLNCKVCRYNLVLKFMPNYASQKKIQIIHKQIVPRPETPVKENSNVNTQQLNFTAANKTHGHDEEMNRNISPHSLIDTSSVDIPDPSNSDKSSIVISAVSSLSVDSVNTQDTCPVCKARAPDGKCSACMKFAYRVESLIEKDTFYECSHKNNSGGPKCRVCRYNQILLLKADQEEKQVVP